MKPASDDFYIGWEDRAPAVIGRRVRLVILGLFLIVVALALALPAAQRTIGRAVFEWGTIRSFSGTLQLEPYPHLLTAPEAAGPHGSVVTTWHLVAPFKFGLDRDPLRSFAGRRVTLRGTRIYRENQAMIEVVPGSVQPAADAPTGASSRREEATVLGRQTIVGEIVDSKCFLGVMNPGALTPHRACAARCISGGIPPVLLVRQTDGTALFFLLVSASGQPVNTEVLDLVAEPVSITGEVVRQGDQLILRADPRAYRRLNRG